MNDIPIREFGSTTGITSSMFDSMSKDAIREIILEQAKREQNILSNIKDMQFVGDIEVFENKADILDRFVTMGWKFKVQSLGYDVLKNYFECRKQHIPRTITLEFIEDMIQRYAQQEVEKEYND